VHRTPLKATLVTPRELNADYIRIWEQLRATNAIYASPFYSPYFTLAVGEVRSDEQVAIFEQKGCQKGCIVGFLPFHRIRPGIAKPIGGHFNDYHGAILEPGLTLADPGLLQSARLNAYDFNHLPSHFGAGLQLTDTSLVSPQMDLKKVYDSCIAAKGESWKRGQRDMARKLRKIERELGPVRSV